MTPEERAFHEGPPLTAVETWVEEHLYPAFNDDDDVEVIEPVFTSVRDPDTFDFHMADGQVFRVTIEAVSG